MPRPALTAEEERETRRTILAQAKRIIVTRGYDALSMRSLAEAVGLSPGALYRYFPSKHDVLTAHSAEAAALVAERLQAIADAGLSPMATVEAMLLEYCRFGAEDRDRFQVLFVHDTLEPPSAAPSRVPGVEAAFALAQAQVQRCLDSGDFTAPSARAATLVLWASVHGLVSLRNSITEIDIGDDQAFFHLGITTVLRGFRSESLSK